MTDLPDVRRVRHELKRRELVIIQVEDLSPAMRRVVLQGEALQGFTSLGFDDHVKLFFAATQAGADPSMRDFTPRRVDLPKGELWIDFFMHEAGPAAGWASRAVPGQVLIVGGPKGSAVLSPQGIDFHLFIGDETALPAVGRRLEELPPDSQVLVVIETADGLPCYPLATLTAARVVWVARGTSEGAPAERLIKALQELEFPTLRCFAWAALESRGARAIRRYLIDQRHLDKHWVKAAGYWQRDAEAIHEVIRDED